MSDDQETEEVVGLGEWNPDTCQADVMIVPGEVPTAYYVRCTFCRYYSDATYFSDEADELAMDHYVVNAEPRQVIGPDNRWLEYLVGDPGPVTASREETSPGND